MRLSARMTPQRRILLETLRRYAPVEDEKGHATAVLFDLMKKHGYNVNPLALTQLLLKAERDGLVVRSKGSAGSKRTYSITLTPATEVALATEEAPQSKPFARCGSYSTYGKRCKLSEGHEGHHLWWVRDGEQLRRWDDEDVETELEPVEPAEVQVPGHEVEEVNPPEEFLRRLEMSMPEGELHADVDITEPEYTYEVPEEFQTRFDYAALADALLAKAVDAIARPQNNQYWLAKQAELEEQIRQADITAAEYKQWGLGVEQKLATAQANLTELREQIDKLSQERDEWQRLAESEEQGVTVFKSRCEEMMAQLGEANNEIARLKGVVKKYRQAEERNGRGQYKFPELANPEGLAALDALIREVPSHRD